MTEAPKLTPEDWQSLSDMAQMIAGDRILVPVTLTLNAAEVELIRSLLQVAQDDVVSIDTQGLAEDEDRELSIAALREGIEVLGIKLAEQLWDAYAKHRRSEIKNKIGKLLEG